MKTEDHNWMDLTEMTLKTLNTMIINGENAIRQETVLRSHEINSENPDEWSLKMRLMPSGLSLKSTIFNGLEKNTQNG